MAAMHENSIKAILIIDTLGKITDFRFKQWSALKSDHLIVEYPHLEANRRTLNDESNLEVSATSHTDVEYNYDIIGRTFLLKNKQVDQVLVLSSDVLLLGSLENIFDKNDCNYYMKGYTPGSSPVVLMKSRASEIFGQFSCRQALSLMELFASRNISSRIFKLIRAKLIRADEAILVSASGLHGELEEFLFDDDNELLKFAGGMSLRWSDFDTLGLKSKIQTIFHETMVNHVT